MECEGFFCPGIEFEPTDEEIVGYFLMLAAMGLELPFPAAYHIRKVDLYGDQSTWEIFADEFPAKKVFYALTTLKSVSKKKMQRTAGAGTWKGPNGRTDIAIGGKVIGEKCSFSYMVADADADAGSKMKKTSHWNMTEYRLFNYHSYKNTSAATGDEEYVFCRVAYSKKDEKPTSLTLKRDQLDDVNNACEVEAGIKRQRIMPDTDAYSCTTSVTLRGGGGQQASHQNAYLKNTCASALTLGTVKDQDLQQQQLAPPSNDNTKALEVLQLLFGDDDTGALELDVYKESDVYKEYLAAFAGPNAAEGGKESSGVEKGQVQNSKEVTEKVYTTATATTTTSNVLVLEDQQPAAINFDIQSNSNARSINAFLPGQISDSEEED